MINPFRPALSSLFRGVILDILTPVGQSVNYDCVPKYPFSSGPLFRQAMMTGLRSPALPSRWSLGVPSLAEGTAAELAGEAQCVLPKGTLKGRRRSGKWRDRRNGGCVERYTVCMLLFQLRGIHHITAISHLAKGSRILAPVG